VAKEFDSIQLAERAHKVGSLAAVTTTESLRPYLIGWRRGGAADPGTEPKAS